MSAPTIAMFRESPPPGVFGRPCTESFGDARHPVVMFTCNGGPPLSARLENGSKYSCKIPAMKPATRRRQTQT